MNRCQGITKKGTQCKRKLKKGDYCHQHSFTPDIDNKVREITLILNSYLSDIDNVNLAEEREITLILDNYLGKTEEPIITTPAPILSECVCCSEEKEEILFECNHFVCRECRPQLRSFNCPFCRANIKESLSPDENRSINTNIDTDMEERTIRLTRTSESLQRILSTL